MKNYFDKNGNYINVENLSLAEIYHRAFALGVESVTVIPKNSRENSPVDDRCNNCNMKARYDCKECDYYGLKHSQS